MLVSVAGNTGTQTEPSSINQPAIHIRDSSTGEDSAEKRRHSPTGDESTAKSRQEDHVTATVPCATLTDWLTSIREGIVARDEKIKSQEAAIARLERVADAARQV